MYRLPNLNRWAGHRFWDGLLQGGRRVPCVGGSDTHQLTGFQSTLFGLGNPTTWVYAEEPSAGAILDGIRAGHTALSYAPDAVRLDFRADSDGDGTYDVMMGDTIEKSGVRVQFHAQIIDPDLRESGVRGEALELSEATVSRLRRGRISPREVVRSIGPRENPRAEARTNVYLLGVLKNGRLFRVWALSGGTVTFRDTPDPSTYYRVELIGDPEVHGGLQRLLYGRVVAMTNPIYVDFPE